VHGRWEFLKSYIIYGDSCTGLDIDKNVM